MLEENADGIHFSFSSLPLPFLRRIVWAWSSLHSALSLRHTFAEKLATKAWFVDLVLFLLKRAKNVIDAIKDSVKI